MLIYHEIEGCVKTAVQFCNDLGISDYVMSLQVVQKKPKVKCAIVFKAVSREYQRYIAAKLHAHPA